MKTFVLSIFLAAVCLSFASPALAVESTEGRTPAVAPKTMIYEIKPGTKEDKEAKAIMRIAETNGKRSEVLTKECGRVYANVAALVLKLRNRIDRAKIEGREMQAADTLLPNVKTHLGEAKALCDQAVAKFDAIPTDDWKTNATAIAEARKLAREARLKFLQVRKDLADTVKALRGGSAVKIKAEPTSSTIAEPTTGNQ